MARPGAVDLALARLAKAEALTAQAQRLAGVGTWQFDTASGLVIWSPEMFRIFGVSPGKFKPSTESFMGCVHPDDRDAMLAVIEETIGGKPMDFVHRIVRPGGEVRHIHGRAQVVVLEKNGAPIMVGTVQDITERRQAEQTIAEQTAQLKEMQAELIYVARQSAMGTMAATLAHELNQPLAAIGNYSAGLKHFLTPDPQGHEALEQIGKNTERAGDIIRHLRNMTRRGTTDHGRSDLAEIINDAVALVTKGSCAECELKFSDHGSYFVHADPIQIGQVVINLVKNACEAVAGSQDCKIVVHVTRQRKVVRVEVNDSGPGISPDVLPTLFEGKASSKSHGMGIGLSISRTIVESHGGNIGAENLKGGGARFWFTLPVSDQPVKA